MFASAPLQDSVFMRWTGKTVIPPLWRRYLSDLPGAVSLLPASAHCCSSSFCKGLYETSLRASSRRRKGGGETSLCYHIPETLTQKNKWHGFKTSCLTVAANRGGESWREMKEKLRVILRLCLQIGITWKVFRGKKPQCPVSLRLIGISEGRRRYRNFDSFPGLYQGSDVW